jgi:hypothetical protein
VVGGGLPLPTPELVASAEGTVLESGEHKLNKTAVVSGMHWNRVDAGGKLERALGRGPDRYYEIETLFRSPLI